MTVKPSQDEWLLDDMTREDFEKLSGVERLHKLMQHELQDLSGDELEARVKQIVTAADGFVKKLRDTRVKEDARPHGGSPGR